ncbi:SDR family NAD(P)-dependent oxidoreductase [Micromonospora sp. KC606]|uniref:SDR family oxidoreductase n=1 Tax=Micromonospora sp. KC606 TaxID=2530379 RepID=UPI001049E368|nr:SDR family NAD(P)-dependent oxidoreductase [Micromonospora sp. KC606]TDC81483.1 SDR family NAD(P)-dependent oxidoreductase [Micromonospora sp. KC606]
MNLADSTILITGATRGVGRELTGQLLGLGAHVAAVGRDHKQLTSLTDTYGDRVTPWAVDLADPDAVDALVQQMPERHPTLSIVINNAAVQTITDLFADDADAMRPVLRREIAINVDAVVALCTGLLPHLRRQPSAAIVNVTTGLALAPKASAPVYCATKAAVRTFTRTLRYQCQDTAPHMRVTDVILPMVDTDMTRGRGHGKITAAAAATDIIAGIRRGSSEVYVGKARLLPALMRLAPALAYRTLRRG